MRVERLRYKPRAARLALKQRVLPVYTVCWSELGIYSQPNTSSMVVFPLKYGNHFNTDSSVFLSNGEYWVRGQLYCYAPYTCTDGYGYVRWAGLC